MSLTHFLKNVAYSIQINSVLAAYDLGAPAQVIKAIYNDEAKVQRPIDLKLDGVTVESSPNPGEVKDDNWTRWLGDQKWVCSLDSTCSSQKSLSCEKQGLFGLPHLFFGEGCKFRCGQDLRKLYILSCRKRKQFRDAFPSLRWSVSMSRSYPPFQFSHHCSLHPFIQVGVCDAFRHIY